MDNIEDILRALADSPDGADGGNGGNEPREDTQGEKQGGLFDGLDPEMLLGLMSAFDALSKTDDNERFLMSLKPLLREENRAKVDTAVKLLKLLSLLPLLKDSGLLKLL